MRGIFGLIQNENMKIYYRVRTWIFYALIVAGVIFAAYIITNQPNNTGVEGDWKEQLQMENAGMEQTLKESDLPKMSQETMENNIKLNKFAIENDLNPFEENTWTFVRDMVGLSTLVTLFVVIVASDMIAGENAWGTIKLLLIRPHSRWKILLSKFLTTVLFAISMMVFMFIISSLVGSIIYGFGGLDAKYPALAQSGEVVEQLVLLSTLKMYGFEMISLIVVVMLAFMISTIFNSSTFAVGASLVILLAGSGIVMVLSQYEWAKYTVFANLDLQRYVDYTYNLFFEDVTLTFSLIVLLLHFIVMVAITWGIFMKRDVKA